MAFLLPLGGRPKQFQAHPPKGENVEGLLWNEKNKGSGKYFTTCLNLE